MNICRSLFAFLLATTPLAVSAQSARDYFNELRLANNFTHYSDEYVCFPADDKGGFFVLGRTNKIAQEMARNGLHKAVYSNLGDHLVVQPYFKGIPSDMQVYEKTSEQTDTEWSFEFDTPLHMRSTYRINWLTGRYRMLVYALDRSELIPAAENAGKCEAIHP